MHWLHMRDHFTSPLLYMVASMTLVMIPYAKKVLNFFENMVGGETH